MCHSVSGEKKVMVVVEKFRILIILLFNNYSGTCVIGSLLLEEELQKQSWLTNWLSMLKDFQELKLIVCGTSLQLIVLINSWLSYMAI